MASYLSKFQRFLLEHPVQSDELANPREYLVMDVSHGQIAVMEYGSTPASRAEARKGFNSTILPSPSRDIPDANGVIQNNVINVKWKSEGDAMFGPAKAAFYAVADSPYQPVLVGDDSATVDAKNAANEALFEALKALLV